VEWKEKIGYILKACSLNKKTLSEKIGFSNSLVCAICNGKLSNPSSSFVQALVDKLNINPVWLFIGDGGFFYNPVDIVVNRNDAELIQIIGTAKEEQNNKIVYIDFMNLETLQIRKLPIMQSLIHPYSPDKVKAVTVSGDNMTNSNLINGDIAIYVEDLIQGNGIYVFTICGITMVNRLEFDLINNKVKILSENDKYSKETVLENNPGLIKIEGKVKTWIHKHPF
jgi:hypothetical protein